MLCRLIAFAFLVTALSGPALAQDAAEIVVRINRLENQVRQMAGQIEELQYENRTLKEQVRKFQEDVEFRFQEGRGGSRSAPSTSPGQSPGGGATPSRPAPVPPQRRGDAFEPGGAPDAPGAPRPLGSTAASAPLSQPSAGAPMPLPGGALAGSIGEMIEADEAQSGNAPLDIGRTARTTTAPPLPPASVRTGPSVAAAGSADPRADYDSAFAFLQQKQYEQAEMGFRRFLQSHPRDKLVPDATYWLGESYLQRNRYREAAEQFLNLSTDYPSAQRAPEALLRLGVSLAGLGARDRACAVFAEVDRKYPQAPASVRQGAEREQKRAKCA